MALRRSSSELSGAWLAPKREVLSRAGAAACMSASPRAEQWGVKSWDLNVVKVVTYEGLGRECLHCPQC